MNRAIATTETGAITLCPRCLSQQVRVGDPGEVVLCGVCRKQESKTLTCPSCKKQVPCAGHPLYDCGLANQWGRIAKQSTEESQTTRLSSQNVNKAGQNVNKAGQNVNKVNLHLFKSMRKEEIVNNLPFILLADGVAIARVDKP